MLKRKIIGLSQEKVNQMNFAIDFVTSIDDINKNEANSSDVKAAIILLLQSLGYTAEDSFGGAIFAEQTLSMKGDLQTLYLMDEGPITLLSLVSTAAKIIEEKRIPGHIMEQVRQALADQ